MSLSVSGASNERIIDYRNDVNSWDLMGSYELLSRL
jgi:hypothetical protein